MRRKARAFAAALALVFAVTTSSLLTAANPADAAQPIVVGSCSTSVEGQPGQPVALSPNAVVQPIVDIIRAVPLLGPTLAEPFRAAFTALPPIPIGSVPTGTTTISGSTIANAVVGALQQIPLLGPVLGSIVAPVRQTLSAGCAVLVTGVNAAAAPVQDGSKTLADASQQATGTTPRQNQPGPATPGTGAGTGPDGSAPAAQPGNQTGAQPQGASAPNQAVAGGLPALGPAIGGFDFGRSPMADYSSIPFAQAGYFTPAPGVRYGGSVPGYNPQFGILGTNTASDNGVHTAGQAIALPVRSGGSGVALPVLLAVLALSGVTAALVRTWVLRRTTV